MNETDNSQSLDLEKLSAENASLRKECGELATLLEKRELELAERAYHLKAMTSLYEEICSSIIWERTAPLRRILDKIGKHIRNAGDDMKSFKSPVCPGVASQDWTGEEWVGSPPDQVSDRPAVDPGLPGTMLELLYVYRIASFGGVERVLLNRSEVFKRHGVPCRISLFFYEDEGAMAQIEEYVNRHALGSHVRIVSKIDAARYDYVISIDTPEILNECIAPEKLLFECHTTYYTNLRYLARLPESIKLIAVPSEAAWRSIAERFPRLREKLFVLRNFIPYHDMQMPVSPMVWDKRPLLYLGRLDNHKNFTEVLDIFQHYREMFGEDLFLLLVGPVVGKVDLAAELSRRDILEETVVMPPVSFDKVWQVYLKVKQHKGAFISASMAESFGLAAAEALSVGLPVLLSGIAPHIDLVDESLAYVYPLGDAVAGARKLRTLIENYERAIAEAEVFGRRFSEELFLSDWQRYIAVMQS